MSISKKSLVYLGTLAVTLAVATPAHAIPAFARKFGTSCLTCHTVYPKLTPFGEAFRRNGYRFPGVDSDFVKQETVALGQESNKQTFPKTVWPATIPISVPLSVGFNGSMMTYPDKNATTPRNNNGTQVSFDGLVAEGHLWLGASLSDTVTLWGEITLSSDGVDIEHAQVLFNDLIGPQHLVNVVVGRGFATLSSFGPHSSYAADLQMPNLPVTAIYGTADATGAITPLSSGFSLLDSFNGIEVNGIVQHRVNYALGVTSSNSAPGFNVENWYASAGFKLGGMRLDGEGDTGPQDSMKPWAETSLTLHGFAFRSNEHFADLITGTGTLSNSSLSVGGGLRGQWGSLELDLGGYWQKNNRGAAGWDSNAGSLVWTGITADVFYGELSYVVFPWFVPVVRVENVGLTPEGGTRVSNLHIMPAIAFAIRPDMKLVVAGNIEFANGFPTVPDASGNPIPVAWQGGSADWGPLSIGPSATSVASSKPKEFESLSFFFAWAL